MDTRHLPIERVGARAFATAAALGVGPDHAAGLLRRMTGAMRAAEYRRCLAGGVCTRIGTSGRRHDTRGFHSASVRVIRTGLEGLWEAEEVRSPLVPWNALLRRGDLELRLLVDYGAEGRVERIGAIVEIQRGGEVVVSRYRMPAIALTRILGVRNSDAVAFLATLRRAAKATDLASCRAAGGCGTCRGYAPGAAGFHATTATVERSELAGLWDLELVDPATETSAGLVRAARDSLGMLVRIDCDRSSGWIGDRPWHFTAIEAIKALQ